MNFFTAWKLGRTLLLTAMVLALGAVCASNVKNGQSEEYGKESVKEAEQRIEKISTYFTDSRDGQKYRAVEIGGKTWMAQNLNYQTGNSWCFGDDNSNCEKYGRLYDWNTAATACPAGWHLSSKQEWVDLAEAAGIYVPGKQLKSAAGWEKKGNGVDGFGFSALPGGVRNINGRFFDAGISGCWWTGTEEDNGSAYVAVMAYGSDLVGTDDSRVSDKGIGYSLRCVADN